MKYLIQTSSDLENAILTLKENRCEHLLLLVSVQSTHDFETIYLNKFNENNFNIYGGIFPGIIFNSKSYDEGVIILALDNEITAKTFDLSLDQSELEDQIADFDESSINKAKTVMTLISAFGADKSIFLRLLYNNYADNVKYIGAGCGSLEKQDHPSIITNNGVLKNSALVISMEREIPLSYSHGWNAFPEVLKVTEYSGNEIVSINWKPALDVYRDLILNKTHIQLTKANFKEVCKSFPFGIFRLDSELIIRDTFDYTDRGGILTVDKIEQGEFIKVMCGSQESLIQSVENMSKENFTPSLAFSCISRKVFLKDKIEAELKMLSKENLAGAFSIGEIINNGDSYLDIFNKIVAVAKW